MGSSQQIASKFSLSGLTEVTTDTTDRN